MLKLTASAPGQPAPSCPKLAAEHICVCIDFTGLMREHERPVRVISLDPGGALIEFNRVNSDGCVQFDIGPDTIPVGQPHLDRNIKFSVKTTQGTVSGALSVRVFP